MRLQNKVIIVTGSCTGIGKAIAKACASEGALLVIHGLEMEWGEEVLSSLKKGGAILQIEDLCLEGAPRRLVRKTLDAFGRVDALVNNAALVHSSNIHTTDLALFRKIMEVNCLAPFALIQEALPHLSLSRGSVLNIGSVNAWSGEPNLMAYSVSKGALMTLTRNLGDTLHRENGVRVNQINPGWVLTEKEAERKRDHGLPEDWYKNIPPVYAPSGRILRPSEIAAAAVFFLSEESGPISGQVMDLEQHPFMGRNPPKDPSTIPVSAGGKG
jgi:NAD(P)-dependent dehydrogenase (short-subunit alcohol dehydrogenase family)